MQLTARSPFAPRPTDWLMLAAILVFTLAISGIGGWVTAANLADWYAGLTKPAFNPPNDVFGPVWTALYLVMSIAIWLAWRPATSQTRHRLLALYAIQLAINLAWSILFFGLHQPLLALLDCLLLLGAIIVMILSVWPISRLAGWLLVPYALWVAFACLLNGAIVVLNR